MTADPFGDQQAERKSYGKTAKVGALWTFLRRIGTEIVGVPTTMVLARLVTPEEFGVAAVGRIFLLLAEHATQTGLPGAMVRAKVLRPEHMSTSLVFGLGTGVLAWLGLTAAAPWLASAFDTPAIADVIPISALAFLIAPWGATARVLVVRDNRFGELATATWVTAIAQGLTSVVLAWRGFGFWSLVYGHLAGDVAGSLAKLYFSRWRPRFAFSREALGELWSYGVARQMKNFARYLAGNVDSLVVARMLGMTALGFYDKAFVSIKRLTGRIDVGQGAQFRILAIIRHDRARFQRAYRKLATARTAFACPIFVGCIVVAPQLFLVLYGSAWIEAVPVFRVLCALAVLQVLTRTSALANEVVGLMWWQVLFRTIYIALVAVGVYVGSRFGILGACWGLFAAGTVGTLMVQGLATRTTGLSWFRLFEPLVPALTAAAVIGTALLGVELAMNRVLPAAGPLGLLLVQAIVAAPLHALLLLYSPFARVRAIAAETVSDFFPGLATRLKLT